MSGERKLFLPEEKHELGLCNPVSSYTALAAEISAPAIQSSGKMHLKYRIPRSSELRPDIFVKALPGMAGIPLRSSHSAADGAGGFESVSVLPRRNLLLLNPSSLDPITPGPGAYLGLTRAGYEREKVAQMGGVMRTVTATNGILRTRRLRESDEATAAQIRESEEEAARYIPGSSVSDKRSHTLSGRAQLSSLFQSALYGTGSLTNVAARRLRNHRPQVNLDTLGECVTSFGLSERTGRLASA